MNAGSCAWAAAAVDFMNGYGLIQGADASTFNWRGSMTRGDLILILYRSASSIAVLSSASMTVTGTSRRPAMRAARQRRSPAMIW